ncbi:dihydrodipicolinate synthase family protein [Bifidobacterium panos]|uniref:Dihydrodipicolinate synthase/N-acetylneuraminate lyase n=1 Tax=Bifidobacterium panos TaxID=2675321 RepID=A0ABX1SYW2_9BIFI|nr:dihydrodipicolinate synthase family protein [Bifidobacterium sp. DSM 109963]NMN01799.1 dihydrodipicolinate synthase/N-acetylneuraminate lyase [Bifidobacterium sp. DSM 109963]
MSVRPEIITASVTAFDADGELSREENTKFLRRIEPYVDGVLCAGTNGEFPALSAKERIALFDWTLQVFGCERTIVHVGAPSAYQALELAKQAAELGATRFAAITPYYLRASAYGVLEYYRKLRDAVEGELYAYIFPDVAGTDVSAVTLSKLAELGIDGVKLSGAASTRIEEYRQAAPNMPLWSGNDADLPHVLAAGGRGVVSGVSGVAPQAWAALRDAFIADDEEAQEAAQRNVQALVKVLGPSIANLKYALNELGIAMGACRMSIDEPDETVKEAIAHLLHNTNIER